MNDLTQKIKQLDKSNVYGSIQKLPDQIEQVINDIDALSLPDSLRNCRSIAISGMGGSIYNYYVLQSLFINSLTVPLTIINGYEIPKSVSENTLVIGSSYSGTTEETVETSEQLAKTGHKVCVVTSGGPLAELCKTYNLTGYIFDPRNNPCGQPRVGLGYMIFGPVMILQKLGFLSVDNTAVQNAIKLLRDNDQKLQDMAYSMLPYLKDQLIVYVAAEHLSGAVHIGRNQLNETAKTFAEYYLIPELNHHLMEGLANPVNKKPFFVLYESNNYSLRVQKRFAVTKQVLKKQNINFQTISIDEPDRIAEFVQIMQINSYISFFLGLSYDIDPSLIPWVDYFKSELKN